MTSIRIDHISKRFGQTTALDNVTFDIAAGEMFFLLGPSGCGKSTLLRIIAGLLEATSGRVFFGDQDVTRVSTQERNAVMCFQSYALWPHMTIAQNVRFGLEVHNIPPAEQSKRVAEVLKLVQMEKLADRKPNQLSGGQQQRVALARALVVNPRCLLLDEPLSNLDAKLRLEMRSEIRRICRAQGLTAIYVTHDQKEALSIADRMAILHAGKIEQIGPSQELYLRPKNKFVAGFMGEANFIDGTVSDASDGKLRVNTDVGEIVGTAVGPTKAGSKVVVSIRPEAIRLSPPPVEAPNQFDAFIHHTQYLGEVAQHQINFVGNGHVPQQTLKAFELNPRHIARDDAREKARIWFDPHDAVVLPD